jgi:hypothetical protein
VAREPDPAARGDRLGISRQSGERWSHFAARVANAFGLVLVLVLATYVLGSLTPFKDWTGVLITLVAATSSVVALAGAEAHSQVVRGAAVLAVAAVALAIVAAFADSSEVLGASAFIVVVLLLVSAGAVLRAVLLETEVGFRTILGAISVYLIFGLLFTFLYAALDRVQSGAFFGQGVTVHTGDTLFFSFTTLTTTGYGNLVPAAQPGKMFAGLEMLIGQIFLVTLVAGLVSLWRPGGGMLKRLGAK